MFYNYQLYMFLKSDSKYLIAYTFIFQPPHRKVHHLNIILTSLSPLGGFLLSIVLFLCYFFLFLNCLLHGTSPSVVYLDPVLTISEVV